MSESAFVLLALAISALALGTALVLRLRRPREHEQVTVDELRARLAAETKPDGETGAGRADPGSAPPCARATDADAEPDRPGEAG